MPTQEEIRHAYVEAWQKELYFITHDKEHIEESIRANEYDFFADGARCNV